MRSGRGKCPQCKETIIVDLDAQEIRCPLCGALLKKSKKTVAEARAEEEARIAAAEARERAIAEAETASVPAPAAVEEPAVEHVPEVPAGEDPVAEVPVEEAPAEEALVEEKADIPADEIGMTDEELAALDDTLPTDEVAAPADEPVDEIGLTDEELASMDAAIPEEAAAAVSVEESAEEVADIDVPVEESAEEVADIDVPIEESAEEAPVAEEEEQPAYAAASPMPSEEEEPAADEESAVEESEPEEIPVEEAPAEEIPTEEVSSEDIPAEAPTEEPEEIEIPEAPAEVPVEENAGIPVEEASEDALAEGAEEPEPVEATIEPAEAPAEEQAEDEAPAEEVSVEPEAPAEETTAPAEVPPVVPVAEVAPAPQVAYTEEDMAFAATLSDGIDATKKSDKKGGYVAPTVKKEEVPSEEDEEDEKPAAPKKKASSGEAVYKKPIAAVMMILAILAAAICFLYKGAFELIPADFVSTVTDSLPFYDTNYPDLALCFLVIVISGLGISGRGKVAFVLTLVAALVGAMQGVFYGNGEALVEVEILATVFKSNYVELAIYVLLLAAAIVFIARILNAHDDLEIKGVTCVAPIVCMVLLFVGYVAIVLVTSLLDFSVELPLEMEMDALVALAIVVGALLLTLVGVHDRAFSRGTNAWFLFANTVAIVLLYAAKLLFDFLPREIDVDHPIILETISPILMLIPLAGFTASDLRN